MIPSRVPVATRYDVNVNRSISKELVVNNGTNFFFFSGSCTSCILINNCRHTYSIKFDDLILNFFFFSSSTCCIVVNRSSRRTRSMEFDDSILTFLSSEFVVIVDTNFFCTWIFCFSSNSTSSEYGIRFSNVYLFFCLFL